MWKMLDFDEVSHVGSFDPALKSKTHNKFSMEGNGLSVSIDPGAWRQIARLGNNPEWVLSVPDPVKFIDVLGMSKRQWKKVTDWALSMGYLESVEVVEMCFDYSDEGDDHERVFTLHSMETINSIVSTILEFEDQLDGGSEPSMRMIYSFKATKAMNDRLGFECKSLALVKDMALTFYVEDVLFQEQGAHGLWWDEKLDPSSYSAPRGVIHKSALGLWSAFKRTAEVARERA